eukprot:gnl/MRDRNA2_/MRDRNA2_102141_c0_seq1.p1 gnl/MRDRNA2_/MRDRNA2_102141_c0~~gnl/MRDRNA2_/MRDRNA2_102141_c0_seq1.p1  ORF type:complete len:2301 (-),score=803.87 gnl/MRDRNA2_/MRDRNA2_102141_c0_seq1:42-6491(-)
MAKPLWSEKPLKDNELDRLDWTRAYSSRICGSLPDSRLGPEKGIRWLGRPPLPTGDLLEMPEPVGLPHKHLSPLSKSPKKGGKKKGGDSQRTRHRGKGGEVGYSEEDTSEDHASRDTSPTSPSKGGTGESAASAASKLKKPKAPEATSDSDVGEKQKTPKGGLPGKSAINKVGKLPGGKSKKKDEKGKKAQADPESDNATSNTGGKIKALGKDGAEGDSEPKVYNFDLGGGGGGASGKAKGKAKSKGGDAGPKSKGKAKAKSRSQSKAKGDSADEGETETEDAESAMTQLVQSSILMVYEQYERAEQAQSIQSYAHGVTQRIAVVEHTGIEAEEERIRQEKERQRLLEERECVSYAQRLTFVKGAEATQAESAKLASNCVGEVLGKLSNEEEAASRSAALDFVPMMVEGIAVQLNKDESSQVAKQYIPTLNLAGLQRSEKLAAEADRKKELEAQEAAKKKSMALVRGGARAVKTVGRAAAAFLGLRKGGKDINTILAKAAKDFAAKGYTPRTAARELQKIAEKHLGEGASQAEVWNLMGDAFSASGLSGLPNPQDDIHEFLAMAAKELAEKFTPRTAAKELEALAAKYMPEASPDAIKEMAATAKSVAGLPLNEEEVQVFLAAAAKQLAEQFTPRTAAKELELLAASMVPPGTEPEKLKELAAGARSQAGIPPTNEDVKVMLAAAAKELAEKYTPRTAAVELERLAMQHLPPGTSAAQAKEMVAAAKHAAGQELSEEETKALLSGAARELAEKHSPRTAARELEKLAVDVLPPGTTPEQARELAAGAMKDSGAPLSDEDVKQLLEVAAKELAEKYTPRTAAAELQKLAAAYLPPGASEQAVKELAAAAKVQAGLPLSEDDTQALLTAAARELSAKYTPRTAAKELETLATKYLPEGTSADTIQAMSQAAMSAAGEPMSEEDAQLLLSKMARELSEKYTPRTAAVELQKLAEKYLPPGTSDEKIKELAAVARHSAGVPLSEEETTLLLSVAARDLAEKHSPRTAARELEALAKKYGANSDQAIKELTAAARQQAGLELSEEDTQALLAAAARELSEKHTPRTAARELEKLAAQYLPEGASEEKIKEMAAAAKADAGQPLSEEEAKVLLAAKAREFAEKGYTPRTAARELEALAGQVSPGTSDQMVKQLVASARLEAGVPLSEEDTKVLLEVAARELAEKYTPHTAAQELEKLAAEYMGPGKSEEEIREATIAAKHAAGQQLSEEEQQVLIASAARDLAKQHTPRTAARELTKLAASCLGPDASAEELRDFMLAQKEAMGEPLTQEEAKMLLAAAAKELAEKGYTPRSAAKELEALAAKLLPGTDEQMLREVAAAAKHEAGVPLSEEETKVLLVAAARELSEKYSPRTAAVELQKLAAEYAPEGASTGSIQEMIIAAKQEAGQPFSEEETMVLLQAAAKELAEKYTPRTAAKELEKLAAQYLPPGTDTQVLREMAAVAKKEAGLPLSAEDQKLVLSSAARELADRYSPRTAAQELEKLMAEYVPEGATEQEKQEMMAAAKAAAGQPLSEEEQKILLAAAARDFAEKYTPRTAARELEKLAMECLPPGTSEQWRKEKLAAARQEAGQPLSEEDKKMVLAAAAREYAAKYTPRTAAVELQKLAAEYATEGASEEEIQQLMAAAKHTAGQPLSPEETKAFLAAEARKLSEKHTPRTAARELEKLAADYLPGASEQTRKEMLAAARQEAGQPLSEEDKKMILATAARELAEKYTPRTAAAELQKLAADYAPEGASEEEIHELMAAAKHAAGQPLSQEETKAFLAAEARKLSEKHTPRTAARELEKLAAQCLPPGTSEQELREMAAVARQEAGMPPSPEDKKLLLSVAARELAEKYSPRTAAVELEKLVAQYTEGASEEEIREMTATAKQAAGQPLSDEEKKVLLAAQARELVAKHTPRTAAKELEKLAAQHGADPDVMGELMAAAKVASGQHLSEEEAKVLLAARAKELAEKGYTPRSAARELEKMAAEYLPPGSSQESILELTAQAKYSAGMPLSEEDAQILLNVAARELSEKHGSGADYQSELEELAAKYLKKVHPPPDDPEAIINFAEKAMETAKGNNTRAQVTEFACGVAKKAMMGGEDMVERTVKARVGGRHGLVPSSRSPSPAIEASSSSHGNWPFHMAPAGRGRSPIR